MVMELRRSQWRHHGQLRCADRRIEQWLKQQFVERLASQGGGDDGVAAVLEQAALDRDLATVRLTLDQFTAYLDSIDVVYT